MGKRNRARKTAAATPVAATERITVEGKWNGVDVPDVSDLDCAFPCRWRELLPQMEELSDDERRMRGPFCDALSSLFFGGGKLSDHGINVRDGYDETKVIRYIRATLGDFGPSHEHKIGGIAHALAKWCTIDAPASQR
ncbi:MAG: hypothetical protein KDJ47_14970 [Hyphomicrobiaceae bacterium]|nr:hypothetical protein [Hyphomicrobiaceae bacterium]